MKRLYDNVLSEHLGSHRQMAFVSGPRQVGKTTTCRAAGDFYLDWDNREHQRLILTGPSAIEAAAGLRNLESGRPVLVFDELHKYPRWRNFLKGLFDLHDRSCRIIVTGSSRLDVYRRGGDSLMGRYFPFRMHPVTIAELIDCSLPEAELMRNPRPIEDEAFEALWRHGGFPEPLLKADDRFSRRWRRLRHDQLFKEDIRDMTRIHDLAMVEIMGRILEERSSEQLVLAGLAQDCGVAPNTAKAWVNTLCSLHVGFLVRPWYRNISSALRKEPKWFLRDWSGIKDVGQRAETFVACHLLKAVEGWTDLGLGEFELRFIRDKQKREVDFLVVRDGEPWFLVEAKHGDAALSPHLAHFQAKTGAPHAFQVCVASEYVDADCFERRTPTVVPARTLLSQLL
jgi:uncharacterized protein